MTEGQQNAIHLALQAIVGRFADLLHRVWAAIRIQWLKARLEDCEYHLSYYQSMGDKKTLGLQAERQELRLRITDLEGSM